MTRHIANQHGFHRAARVIAQKHDLTVTFSKTVDSLQIDGNRVTVPMLPPDVTQEALDRVLTDMDYFGSMWRYSDAEQVKNLSELPHDKPVGWLYRLFNDERIMRAAASEFLGSKQGFSHRTAANMGALAANFGELDAKQQACIAASIEASSDWNAGASVATLESAMSEEGKQAYQKLVDAGLPDMARVLKNGGDARTLADAAYRLLWEDSEEEEKQPDDGDGEGEGSGGDGGGEGKVESAANPFNPGHDKMKVSAAAATGSEKDGQPSMVRVTSKIVDTDSRHPLLEPAALVQELRASDYEAGGVEVTLMREWIDDASKGAKGSPAVFANKVRRHLQARAAVSYEHGQRRGKISSKSIYRIAIPQEARTKACDRVFKRRVEDDVLDTAVQIMVDMSGSMMGETTGHTYKATCLLANALYVLGVPCEINAFTTRYNPALSRISHRSTVIWRIKDWSERVTDEVMEQRYAAILAEGMCNNNDSAALLYAHDRLLHRDEKRKILLMQSDGSPSAPDTACHNVRACLKSAAKLVEADKRVDLLSLGVGSSGVGAVRQYYKNWTGVEDASRLETALFDLIANRMLRQEGE